ncbi:MAG: hypothetical protein ACP5RI_00235 [Candidatus Micrarchaeia archaeon]
MSFYGLLLLGCIMSTIVVIYSLNLLYNVNSMINFVTTKYSYFINVESFALSLKNSHINYIDNSIYNNWLNQLNVSAYVDGLNIKKEGRLYIVSSYQDPSLYEAIYVN